MKNITFFMACIFSTVMFSQSTINITTSGGSFASEKWVNITTAVNDGGTQVWGQGDGSYGNGAGLINQDIILTPGTYYVNCFDNYADGWDGTLISVTAYGSVLGDNGGASPDDGTDTDATGGVFDDRVAELEASFVIVVPNPPACDAPTNLNATTLDTSADFSWNAPGSGTPIGYNWEIQPDGVAQGTPGAVASGSTATNTVNSGVVLTASTSYEFYVQTDCGGDGTSTWAGPLSFTTLCATVVPDYLESFDTAVPPSCWTEAGSGNPATGPSDLGTGLWNHDEFANIGTTNNSAQINLYTNNREDWLISPLFDLSAGGYELVYTVALTDFANSNPPELNGMGSDDEVQVLISTDNGATWVNLATYNQASYPSETGDVETFDLTAYTGTVQFAIWATDGTVDDAEDYDFFIDEFIVRTPLACTSAVVDSSTIVNDCNSDQFFIDLNITLVGDGTQVNDGTTSFPITGTGVLQVGPYVSGSTVTLAVNHSDVACDFSLGDFSFSCPPINDDCSAAVALTAGETYGENPVDGTLIGATDSGYTNSCGGTAVNDVWYTAVAPTDGNLTIETEADIATGTTGNDTAIEAYTSDTDCSGTLTSIGCDDDGAATGSYSKLDLTGLTPGQTIYIRVWGFGDDEFEPFSISAFSATLSTNEFDNATSFSFFPNPANNTLNLEAQNTIEEVVMFNMLGQNVLTAKPNAVTSKIDMSALNTGAYFVKVTIDGATKTVRVIKQ